jgi:glycine betaine/proline transport system permease protein
MNFFTFEEQLIPLDSWIQTFVSWLVINYRDFFQAIKVPIELSLQAFEWFFTTLPPLVIILLFGVAAWRFAGKGMAVFTVLSFFLVGYLGLWRETMVTISMVISSVFSAP